MDNPWHKLEEIQSDVRALRQEVSHITELVKRHDRLLIGNGADDPGLKGVVQANYERTRQLWRGAMFILAIVGAAVITALLTLVFNHSGKAYLSRKEKNREKTSIGVGTGSVPQWMSLHHGGPEELDSGQGQPVSGFRSADGRRQDHQATGARVDSFAKRILETVAEQAKDRDCRPWLGYGAGNRPSGRARTPGFRAPVGPGAHFSAQAGSESGLVAFVVPAQISQGFLYARS